MECNQQGNEACSASEQKRAAAGNPSEIPHYVVLVFILAMIGGGIWNVISNVKAYSAAP